MLKTETTYRYRLMRSECYPESVGVNKEPSIVNLLKTSLIKNSSFLSNTMFSVLFNKHEAKFFAMDRPTDRIQVRDKKTDKRHRYRGRKFKCDLFLI